MYRYLLGYVLAKRVAGVEVLHTERVDRSHWNPTGRRPVIHRTPQEARSEAQKIGWAGYIRSECYETANLFEDYIQAFEEYREPVGEQEAA